MHVVTPLLQLHHNVPGATFAKHEGNRCDQNFVLRDNYSSCYNDVGKCISIACKREAGGMEVLAQVAVKRSRQGL